MSESELYALILAGGSGTRLWPLSRAARPKQFLDLFGGGTMLQLAYRRLAPMVPSANVYVATNREHVGLAREELPELPPPNVLGEPEGRGNAAAIGYAAIRLARRDPRGVMIVVTADHLITKVDAFRTSLRAATEIAREGWLVTLGIQPTHPETGFGYVERSEPIGGSAGLEAYRVARFVEKPSRARAEEYLAAGTFSWNSGMFIWRVDQILEEFQRQMPGLYRGLEEIARDLGTPLEAASLERVWPTLPKQTIDFGVMEHAEKVAVIPVDIGWSDVGSWQAVYDELPKDENGNAAVGEHLAIDSRGSLVFAPGRLVATIGLDDLVVVDSGDAILVCPKSRAQDVRQIVSALQARRDTRLL